MIIDTKYKNYNLNTVMDQQHQHLNYKERHILLTLLRKSEDLFNRTLGTCNTTLVDLELKDYEKPVCLRLYTVPRLHK